MQSRIKGNSDGQRHHLTTARVQALADGVFAIAMTLLVLSLTLPDEVTAAKTPVHELLLGQAHKFINYVLGFILLAILWIDHHRQFHWIKRTDNTLLWINIFILIYVALMPFSVDLVGDFVGQKTATIFFAGNLFLLGVLFFFNWTYATRHRRLTDADLSDAIIVRNARRNLIMPLVSAVVIVLAFFIANWAALLLIIVPILDFLPVFRS